MCLQQEKRSYYGIGKAQSSAFGIHSISEEELSTNLALSDSVVPKHSLPNDKQGLVTIKDDHGMSQVQRKDYKGVSRSFTLGARVHHPKTPKW